MRKSNPLRTILPKAVCILALILFFSCEQVVFDNPFAAGIDLEVNRPAVPTGIEVSAGDSSLLVTWSRIQGADSYQLFYGTTSNREQATAANDDNPRDTQCALTALTNESLYYLWLRSVNNAGNSDWSPYTIAIPTTFTQAPSTPSGLTLIAVDGGFYTLWEEAERAVYYEVWYSTTANRSDGQMFLDADPTDHYCGIQGLTNGTTYNVWVRAINGFSQGEFSSAASGNPIPYSSGLLITAADTDFNYNKTNSLDVSLTFTEAVANSADMGVYDFSITGQNGEDYPVTAVSWNSARTQAVLTIDVSTVERESSEEWNVSLSGIQPVNSYSQIPWLHGSDLGFTVAIRSIDPPTGLDNDDIVIRSGGKSGTAFFYSGTFSEAFNSSSGYITDETLYIKVDPRSHRETENFTLHYTIDGGANWTPLTGGEALIPVPSSTIALDVEYIYDIRSHVKSDGFDVVEIPVDYEAPWPSFTDDSISFTCIIDNSVTIKLEFDEDIANTNEIYYTISSPSLQMPQSSQLMWVGDNKTAEFNVDTTEYTSRGSYIWTVGFDGNPRDTAGNELTDFSIEIPVEVQEPQVENLAFDRDQLYLSVKDGTNKIISHQPDITITPDNAANKTLIWSSSNTDVATVTADGKINSGSSPGTATITARSTNGIEASCEVTVMVPFVSVWAENSNNPHLTLELPLINQGQGTDGEYDFYIDWGDGNKNLITNGQGSSYHEYSNSDRTNARIEIAGKIKGWRFGNDNENAGKLTKIESWGPLAFNSEKSDDPLGTDSSGSQFKNCNNLEITAEDMPDLSNTYSLASCFENCSILKKIPNLRNWEVENITNIKAMFSGIGIREENKDSWNTDDWNLSDWKLYSIGLNYTNFFSGTALDNRDTYGYLWPDTIPID